MFLYLEAPVSIFGRMAGVEYGICIDGVVDSFGELCRIRLEEAVDSIEYNPLIVHGPFGGG